MIDRRSFITGLSAGGAFAAGARDAPRKRFAEERVERITAPPKPALAINHLGFTPPGRKSVVFRLTGGMPAEFTFRDIGSSPKPPELTRRFTRFTSDLGDCLVGDLSDIVRPGMYQVEAGGERSVPFFIGEDVWRRTLVKAVSYIHAQRCGTAVPNVHPVCHLDDARRRDNGGHVDTTGGWHDAGDLRKWMSATVLNGIALMGLLRNLGDDWDAAGSGAKALLDEARWGNTYFLKMQDGDGLVWDDVAGGVNGDNSDNHWTDNRTGTGDDRYINTNKSGSVQALFTLFEAMMATAFRAADPAYSERCLRAAVRCWDAATRSGGTGEVSWWALAAMELGRATGAAGYRDHALKFGSLILSAQNTAFTFGQKFVRGWFRVSSNSPDPYADVVHGALPVITLLLLAQAYPDAAQAGQWGDAVKLHLDGYVLPMAARSPYGIVPFGIFHGTPSAELYRPLAGELTYRFFMPVQRGDWWIGSTSHLESYALAGILAASEFGNSAYRDLAMRQLEWVMGANPFGACLMTGEGMRNPYPHSRFVGLIPGGIMNGIAGNANDEPILDIENGFDWRTTEYWTPHNAYYILAVSALHRRA
ncbi:MAG: glycoside hydrolase family 9 protein [Bryobacterales bacterium]|nr:glycoside hydrolase family 9 protein [Bryobacterales bacterium]